MNTMRIKQALTQLCEATSPAPFFELDIKTGLFFSTANGFTIKTKFHDPTSISILSAIIGKQISIIKLLLVERTDLTETERLAYRSLQERFEIFLDMLTMSSIFVIHEHGGLDSTSNLEFTLHKLKYAIHNYKSNINTLQKDLFPIQTKKLEAEIQLIIANSMHQFKQDTMIFTNYLHYFKPVVTSSWEFGEYLQNNTMLAFRNIDSRTIEPFLNFIDNILYRIAKLIIIMFILYIIVNLVGIFAPSVIQYIIQKIMNYK
jgi:hypothetical protein